MSRSAPPLGPEERERVQRRFARIGEWLAEDEHELRLAASRQNPGDGIARGLRLYDSALADYRQLLCDPAFARAEHERALAKAGLHDVWRARHR